MSDETRKRLREMAKEMGDAGYCNYDACQEFLERAYELGVSAAVAQEQEKLRKLEEIMQAFADGDVDNYCGCPCNNEDCCLRVGEYCAHCLARRALAFIKGETR